MPEVVEKRVDLVFEGGGVKGIALVGALSALEERGFEPQNVAGTSAGALVAVLLAAGYPADEMRDLLLDLDFGRFRDKGWEDRIPIIGTPLSLIKDQGVYEGEALLEYVRGLLAARDVRTFGDLARSSGSPRFRHRAQVIASDLTARRLLVLPRDAGRLGVEDADALEVALAVRMSAGLPFFYEPVRFRNPATGRDHLVVDGGILSNFPVWLFDSQGVPEWPTFGLMLVESEPRKPVSERIDPPDPPVNRVEAVVDYVRALVETMLEARDRLYIETADFARTIPIPTLGVRTADLDLSPERRLALYEAGRAAAEEFLETWDFEAYVAEFRRGKHHSRRETVVEQMNHRTEPQDQRPDGAAGSIDPAVDS